MQKNIVRTFCVDPETRLRKALGAYYDEYRASWDSVTRTNFPQFPIHIDFELNDLCNQSCVMCPRNEWLHDRVRYPINTGAYLDFGIYAKVIDEGASKGLRSINLGAFAEPLVHPRFVDFVRYAKKKGIVDIRVITNGLLLGKFVDQVIEAGVTNLFVSVDAMTKETYRKIRGHGFDKVVGALNALLFARAKSSSGLPVVRVSFVDLNLNRAEKKAFVEYWKERVDFVDVQVADNYNYAGDEKVDFGIPKKWDCMSPWARVAVLADGTVLPCCNFFGRNLPLGNVRDSSIEDIWRSPAMQSVREGVTDGSCSNCELCQRV